MQHQNPSSNPGTPTVTSSVRTGTLYLVRHAQASFGSDDYDNLSALGRRQSVRLGEYWRERDLQFDAVITGTLRRHRQTWEGIAEGLGRTDQEVVPWPGLNEYNGQAIIECIYPEKLPKCDTPELYREHFRRLREGLNAWMHGRTEPIGMPSYADFRAGVIAALDHVREKHPGSSVLMVSSGGPISTAVGHVLDTSASPTIELNLRIRNTAMTEFAFTPKRHTLITYNTLPHLDDSEHVHWITYS